MDVGYGQLGAQEREWDVDYLLGHKIWITTRIANSNWWRNPRGMWIVYLGHWVWTTGRFRRGAGMWIVYHRHKVWVTTRMYRGKWWLTRRGMWIVYHGRWVWTTGRFKRGAGLWIVYHKHKVWVTTRMVSAKWWLNRRGMWIIYHGRWCGQVEGSEEEQVYGLCTRGTRCGLLPGCLGVDGGWLRACGSFRMDAGCGQLEYVEEVMGCGFLTAATKLDYNQNG